MKMKLTLGIVLVLTLLVMSGCDLFDKQNPNEVSLESNRKVLISRDSLMRYYDSIGPMIGRSVPNQSKCGEMYFVESHFRPVIVNRYEDDWSNPPQVKELIEGYFVSIPKIWYDTHLLNHEQFFEYLSGDSKLIQLATKYDWEKEKYMSSGYDIKYPISLSFDRMVLVANAKSKFCGLDTVYQYNKIHFDTSAYGREEIFLDGLVRRNVMGYKIPSYFQFSELCRSGRSWQYPWGATDLRTEGVVDLPGYNSLSVMGLTEFFKMEEWIDDDITGGFDLNKEVEAFNVNPKSRIDVGGLISEGAYSSRTSRIIDDIGCDIMTTPLRIDSIMWTTTYSAARFVIQDPSSTGEVK